MGYILLVIIGVPILCVICYGAIDALVINMHEKVKRHRMETNLICFKKEREIKRDNYRRENLNKANELIPKYLVSHLTSSLLEEINKIAFRTGDYIHRVSFNKSFGNLIIDGGTNQAMYINDLSRLGETSSLAKLGYKFPEGRDYYIHAVALLTAIAQKLGSNYRVDISYDYDDEQIYDILILNKNLKWERDLKLPI